MPGTFAHLTLVRLLCGTRIGDVPGLDNDTRVALRRWSAYCELGGVSPDYPSLQLLDSAAARWADVMHYYRTADQVRFGIDALVDHPPPDPLDRERALAWLFGYTAHLVADMTVHPVIARKVGCYEGHEDQHRRCELHQDAYIFERKLGHPLAHADDLRSGLMLCVQNGKLHPAVVRLWLEMLQGRMTAHERDFALGSRNPTRPADPAKWHDAFTTIIDGIAEELPFFARGVAGQLALSYPSTADIDRTYIDDLTTPAGQPTAYEPVFEQALTNTARYWGQLHAALQARDSRLFTLPNGNLDTGVADSTPFFWSAS